MDLAYRKEAIQLHARVDSIPEVGILFASVVTNTNAAPVKQHAFLVRNPSFIPEGYPVYLVPESLNAVSIPSDAKRIVFPEGLSHLDTGDIVRFNGVKGEILVLFKASFSSNSVLLTERCNSWCVMCSQPPRNRNDDWIADEWLGVIPLIPKNTESMGITGGEPTLLGKKFLDVIAAFGVHLPATSIHVLSNGKNFAYLSLAKALADLNHPAITIAIPLYSDIAWRHEFVVQSKHSFDHTIRGILNLARCGISVEIRVVLHRFTIPRLKHLAAYIVRNFPFTAHVALMGLEPIGFGRSNYDALWVDPVDYTLQLAEAADELLQGNIPFSIYNHQLCTIPEKLWPFCVPSISEWKNIYIEECVSCQVKGRCGGFFHSAVEKHSRAISPVKL